jgi:hypothetical protein
MDIILGLFAIFALFELIAAILCPKWLVAFATFPLTERICIHSSRVLPSIRLNKAICGWQLGVGRGLRMRQRLTVGGIREFVKLPSVYQAQWNEHRDSFSVVVSSHYPRRFLVLKFSVYSDGDNVEICGFYAVPLVGILGLVTVMVLRTEPVFLLVVAAVALIVGQLFKMNATRVGRRVAEQLRSELVGFRDGVRRKPDDVDG